MTREESEKYIKSKMCNNCGIYLGGGKCSDNCNVIKAIQALSQEPCDDAVRRDAVIKEIFYSSDNSCDVVLSTELMDRINKLPSVTQKSGTGIA